jgi:LacI family transcriptional regulator, repressor for deo operon, udp, cdd, tsx, nupC, and nupG
VARDREDDGSASMRDVAEAAGVAVSTVSRALSRPDRVNARTRDRIVRIAAELGYRGGRPAPPARLRVVALLVPDVRNPFFLDIVHGMQSQLRSAGYRQLLVETDESAEVELEALRDLRGEAAGSIVVASRLTDAQLLVHNEQHPIVTVNRGQRGVPTVVIDTSASVTQAVEHLASLGHTDIGYVGGPATSWSNERRKTAFSAAAAARGMRAEILGPFVPLVQAGAAAADALVARGVTACVAFNDLLAVGILRRLAERGIAVPGAMSVVGCDDVFAAAISDPALTTITAPLEHVGREAVSLLMSRIHGGSERRLVVLPTFLTVRASTGAAPRD